MALINIPLDVERYRERLASLTLRQRQIMLLVDEGHISKVIAGALQISTSVVNKHISKVRGNLDNLPRREAGRLVAAYEAELAERGQSIPPLSLPLAPILEIGPIESGADEPGLQETLTGILDQTDIADSQAAAIGYVTTLPRLFGLQSYRRQANDLATSSTLIVIAVLSLIALFGAGAAVSLLNAFGDRWPA